LFGIDRIEDFSQASIAGYVFHVEDHPQVLLVPLSSLVKSQQGRILESANPLISASGKLISGFPVLESGMSWKD
jgi:hypothetical protein